MIRPFVLHGARDQVTPAAPYGEKLSLRWLCDFGPVLVRRANVPRRSRRTSLDPRDAHRPPGAGAHQARRRALPLATCRCFGIIPLASSRRNGACAPARLWSPDPIRFVVAVGRRCAMLTSRRSNSTSPVTCLSLPRRRSCASIQPQPHAILYQSAIPDCRTW